MENIQDYINKTKSAVQKLYEAYISYYELLKIPERPVFFSWGDPNSVENKIAHEKWEKENSVKLKERTKRDNEFADEFFARSMLCGSILQFAYQGIKTFSLNTTIPDNFNSVIKPKSTAEKFCIGRLIDDVPIGLIIFAGRNQAMHYDQKTLKEPNKTIFYKLANWYSETYKKWFIDSYFDLNNKDLIHYSENILYKMGWANYEFYEKELIEILHK